MNQPKRRIDRVEAFASAVDAFEPARLTNEADLFSLIRSCALARLRWTLLGEAPCGGAYSDP